MASSVFTANSLPRVYAQNVVTGAWVHRDITMSQPQVTRALYGGDQLTFNITPVDPSLLDSTGNPVIKKWQTAIYIEEGNQIKWGGLVTSVSASGPTLSIACVGFCGYANGYTFESYYSQTDVDPMDVVRYLWANMQAQNGGNLGMVVDSTTSYRRLGFSTQQVQTTVKNSNGTSTTKTVTQTVPYVLSWQNSTDVGQEIQNLADQVPFDYTEYHSWTDSSKTAVSHRLALLFPRAGKRKESLRFAEGENIVQTPTVTDDGTSFAQNVIVQGAGSGYTTIRGAVYVTDGHLRRNVVYTDQMIKSDSAAQNMATTILPSYQNTDTVTSIVIKDHPNATFGSFDIGDDILITLGSYWRKLQVWHRIVSYTQDPTTNQMTLNLARSDSFTYLPATGTAGSG